MIKLINNFIEIKKIIPEKYGDINVVGDKPGASKGIVIKGNDKFPEGSYIYFTKNSEMDMFGRTIISTNNIIIKIDDHG